MNRYASALSQHPVPAHAVGEVVGFLLEQLEAEPPDLLVLFASPHFAGALDDMVEVLRDLVEPRVLVGMTAAAVIGGSVEAEEMPALSAWAACLDGDVEPVALRTVRTPDGHGGVGLAAGRPGDRCDHDAGGRRHAPAPRRPVHVPGRAVPRPRRRRVAGAPGGRRAGVRGGGSRRRPARDRRRRAARGCGRRAAPRRAERAGRRLAGLPPGRPGVHRHRLRGQRREGARRASRRSSGWPRSRRRCPRTSGACSRTASSSGSWSTSTGPSSGGATSSSAACSARTARTGRSSSAPTSRSARPSSSRSATPLAADEDLRELLTGVEGRGALLFSCTGRGGHLFPEPHHDAQLIEDMLGPLPLAGAFCAGELGPVGGPQPRPRVHGERRRVRRLTNPGIRGPRGPAPRRSRPRLGRRPPDARTPPRSPTVAAVTDTDIESRGSKWSAV